MKARLLGMIAVAMAVVVSGVQAQDIPQIGADNTLEVATWNLFEFGSTSGGPGNENEQRSYIRQVIRDSRIDVWALQEISSSSAFNTLLNELGSEWAGEYSSTSFNSRLIGFIWRKSQVSRIEMENILTGDDEAFGGRPPLRFEANVTVNGETRRIFFIGIDADSEDDFKAWQRRKNDAGTLKQFIDSNHSSARVIVLGGFQDEIGSSFVSGQDTPYRNFLDAGGAYTFVSKRLNDSGQITKCQNSTCNDGWTFDHVLASNEAASDFVTSSDARLTAVFDIPNYVNSTSNHVPVYSKFKWGSDQQENRDPVANNDDVETDEGESIRISVLDNDSDPDGDSIQITWVNQNPSNGNARITSDQKVEYTPNTGFSGQENFSYTISDGRGGDATGNIRVIVKEEEDQNRSPFAENDEAAVEVGGTTTIDVLANDSDPDGDSLSLIEVDDPDRGDAVEDNGKVRYTANSSYQGIVEFTYKIRDSSGASAEGTVTVQITNQNIAPQAVDDSYSIEVGETRIFDVLENDSDVNGDNISITDVSRANHGSVRSTSDNKVEYSADAGYIGTDEFTYKISDGSQTDEATVRITIGGGQTNRPPVAGNDSGTTGSDGKARINVLSNDSDPDGDSLTIDSIGNPPNGSARKTSDNRIEYTADSGFSGTDSFTYTVADPSGATASGTVTVNVPATNAAPRAENDNVTISEARRINVLQNDGDPDGDELTITSVGPASNGTVEIIDNQIEYTPNSGFIGDDQFGYTVADDKGANDSATVNVRVIEAEVSIAIRDDAVSLAEDASIEIDVLGNDAGGSGATLSVDSITVAPIFGTAVLDAGRIIYTPDLNFHGRDSLSYRAVNSSSDVGEAIVRIQVSPLNDAPDAVADTVEVMLNQSSALAVTGNDTDVDGDTITIDFVSTPQFGIAVLDASGALINYTPNLDYVGPDQFKYFINDGVGAIDSAIVSIKVFDTRFPVASDDLITMDEDTQLQVGVLQNDSDPVGEGLVVARVGPPANGEAVIEAGTTIRYTPNKDFFGEDSFWYWMTDQAGIEDSAMVTVTVQNVNDPPVAADDVATSFMNRAALIQVLGNDLDVDAGADSLQIFQVTPSSYGSVSVLPNGLLEYKRLDTDFTGFDSFAYFVIDQTGATDSATVRVELLAVAASADGSPVTRQLHDAFPNPFFGQTTLRYDVSVTERVRIELYDALGRLHAVLVDERMNPGSHTVTFDTRRLPAGVLFARMIATGFQQTKRLVRVN